MGKLAKTGTWPDEFKELENVGRSIKEHNDCTVKAVSLVCNVSYREAHAAMMAEGRKHGGRAQRITTRTCIAKLGIKLIPVDENKFVADRYAEWCEGYPPSLTSYTPKRFSWIFREGETYLCFARGHVFVIKDGITLDWSINRSLRIQEMFLVGK